MKADAKTAEEVDAAIRKVTGAYKARNLEGTMAFPARVGFVPENRGGRRLILHSRF